MSYNQSMADRSDSSQYRKAGRSGSFSQRNNNYSGNTGKGGGVAAPPPSSNLQQNRSFSDKSNNVRGGQSRASEFGVILNPDSNSTPANRPAPNGSHSQPAVPAPSAPVTGTIIKQTADQPAQRSAQVVQKAQSSQATNVKPDPGPHATPTKGPGDASKSFPIQFGNASPGTLNGMQAHRDLLRQAQQFPIPSVPKQQIPRKNGGVDDQPKTGEAHQIPMAKRDIQVPSPSRLSQTQKAPVHNISGISMPMPFHQQQVPVQFGGPIPQIRSQVIGGASLPMPMPLPMGSAQLPQSVYVSGLHPHPHPMQAQGIIHQGQGLNFTTHMGPQMPPQLGNMRMGAGAQFPQVQPLKFVASRKAVKITHPDTHEELKLENATDPRSHQNVPRPRPVTSAPSACPLNSYPNPVFYSAQGPVPLNSATNPASLEPPRFGFPVSQGPQTASLMNPSHMPSIVDGSHDRFDSIKDQVKKQNTKGSSQSPCQAASDEEKRVAELNKLKSSAAKRKKKLKEILQKADAAGKTLDLYKEKPVAELNRSKRSGARGKKKLKDDVCSSEKDEIGNAVPDDWEEAVDFSIPKLETDYNVNIVSRELSEGIGLMKKKYTRDFLLKFSRQCIDLLEGFEITSVAADALMVPNVNASRVKVKEKPVTELNRSKRSGARGKKKLKGILQKPDVAGKTLDLHNSCKGPEEEEETVATSESNDSMEVLVGSLEDDVCSSENDGLGKVEPDDWESAVDISTPKLETDDHVNSGRDPRMDVYGRNFRPGQRGNVLRNPRGLTPAQYAGGILSGPMQSMGSHGGVQRSNSVVDRWQRATGSQKGLLPLPTTPALVMHKAERKYQLGKVTDEEEANQRQLKAILNKLNPSKL